MMEESIPKQEGLSEISVGKKSISSESNEENINLTELKAESKGETQKEISKLVNEFKQGEKIGQNKQEELGELDIIYEYGIKFPELDQSEKEELALETEKIKRDCKFALPALFKGNKTATKYSNSTAANFSTITNNVTLESGKELFVIYNYRTSGVHCFLDGVSKKMVGLPMKKANYKEWAGAFRKKSLLPVLDLIDDKGDVDGNMVVLERIPNINIYDLITNFNTLKNPDSKVDGCDFVKNMKKEDLLGVVGGVAREIVKIHNKDTTWGEVVPSNIIIDKNQKIHICDPETVYDKNLSIHEQKAFDLLECVTSFSSVMNRAHQIPYTETVNTILNNYVALAQDNEKVIIELKKISEKKLTFVNKLGFAYLKAHLFLQGISELMEIRKNIVDFEVEVI
ncbi:MAG: hypothetical protein PHC65_07495 [Methanobacteriaceae archaeon]|nr:hypothetical protein [Methanobacteriaceae archaeon]